MDFKKLIRFIPVLLFLASLPARGLENGLARTPPMGWNSWNRFGCHVTAKNIRDAADAMVSSGMKAAGYEYINVDDCWQFHWRWPNGKIMANPFTFFGGMKSLADYVHSKGLKFGVYSDAGRETCGHKPGGYGHEEIDANTYAEWGVDYLKYDFCSTDGLEPAQTLYERMRDALAQTGRDIVFSLCSWGLGNVNEWGPQVGNLWRTTGDIRDDWAGFIENLDRNGRSDAISGPGAWNDPDMLTVGLHGKNEIGGAGMTDEEYRAQFSLWALMAAPLIVGNDLRQMDPVTLETLTNQEVIAVDQDPLGTRGRKIRSIDGLEVWAKLLSEPGTRAVVLFNRTEESSEIDVQWKELSFGTPTASVRDLWQHQDQGIFTDHYSQWVPSHSAVLLRIQEITR